MPVDSRGARIGGEAGFKSSREECYRARDLYFQCLAAKGETACCAEYQQFDQRCPESWVQHFIRKQRVEQYKEKVTQEGRDKIEEQGYNASEYERG